MNKTEWKLFYRDIRIKAKKEAEILFKRYPLYTSAGFPYCVPIEINPPYYNVGVADRGDGLLCEVLIDKNGKCIHARWGDRILSHIIRRRILC